MKPRFILLTIFLVNTMVINNIVTAGKSSTEALAFNCMSCHGPQGNSVGPATPSIAGMSAKYIVKSMQDFKSYEREATIMNRIAMGYDNDDFDRLGQYFSEQPRIPLIQPSGDLADTGREIHQEYCSGCHQDNGTSAEDNAGFLQGQWKAYLDYSLADALDGARPMKRKMIRKLKAVLDEQGKEGLQSLLDFYASDKSGKR